MKTYTFQGYEKERMARVARRDIGVSTKHSIEICNWIRNKNLQKAKQMLEEVIAKKRPLPLKRFKKDRGHKAGIMAGAYPVKASLEILSLLKSVEANAQFKGLNTSQLTITHINSNRGARPYRYGRHFGRQTKNTHIEIVVEAEEKKKGGEK